MKNLTQYIVNKTHTISQALSIIDKGALRIAVVVENKKVLGTLNDGDIRRGLLKGYGLDTLVEDCYNPNATLCHVNDDKQTVMRKAVQKKVYQIPIVDDNNYLVDLIDFVNFFEEKGRDNKVLLMAGGLGTRLRPLTEDIPKSLLHVGGKPILETIIKNLSEQNFKEFVISVNYKADMIKAYFGDGLRFGVKISYLEEKQRLGTAGALSLIDSMGTEPFFVMNADLLTNVDFEKLLDFHKHSKSKATMCVREYEVQIPYGVIEVDKSDILSIVEKPVQKFFVNAGIYVLDADLIQKVPKNVFFDMPTLFENLITEKEKVSSFPIHEYWLDIGQLMDYERANAEYSNVFKTAT